MASFFIWPALAGTTTCTGLCGAVFASRMVLALPTRSAKTSDMTKKSMTDAPKALVQVPTGFRSATIHALAALGNWVSARSWGDIWKSPPSTHGIRWLLTTWPMNSSICRLNGAAPPMPVFR